MVFKFKNKDIIKNNNN